MNAVRLRQARLVAAPLWRAGAWRLVPLAALGVMAVTVAARGAGADVDPAAVSFAASLLMAAAAGYAMDDASAALVATAPAPLAFRLGMRVLGVVVLVGTCWAATLAYLAPVEVARPTLVLAVLVAVSLLSGARFGGVSSGPLLCAFVVGASSLPDRFTLFATGRAADARLAGVLFAAAFGLAFLLRDPASAERGGASPSAG